MNKKDKEAMMLFKEARKTFKNMLSNTADIEEIHYLKQCIKEIEARMRRIKQ